MLTNQDWQSAAQTLGCEVAAIRAVADVEGSGVGFTTVNGQPKPIILFEPHIFWRELKKRGLNPDRYVLGNGDILYQKWGSRPYPNGQAARYAQLDKAAAIDREAALCAASWGQFQIMGFNHAACGCPSIQAFVNEVSKDEAAQLALFTRFIQSNGMAAFLTKKDWEGFARHYNGAGFEKNNYHKRLNTSYLKYKAYEGKP